MEVNACSISVFSKHFTFAWLFCMITLQIIEQILLGLEYDGILSGPSTKDFGYSLVRLVCSWFFSLVILHWAACVGFDSSLTVPISGTGLCQNDRDTEALMASWSSLDQLGDLKQVVFSQDSVFSACLRSHTDWKLSWVWKLPLARLSTQCSHSEGAVLPQSVQSHILQVLITSGGWKEPSVHTKQTGESGSLRDTLEVPLTGNGSNGLQSCKLSKIIRAFWMRKCGELQECWQPGLSLYLCSSWSQIKQISTIRVHVSVRWEKGCLHTVPRCSQTSLLSVPLTKEGGVVPSAAASLVPWYQVRVCWDTGPQAAASAPTFSLVSGKEEDDPYEVAPSLSLSISRNPTRNRLNHTSLGSCFHHSRMGLFISHTPGSCTAVAQPPPFCPFGNDVDKNSL